MADDRSADVAEALAALAAQDARTAAASYTRLMERWRAVQALSAQADFSTRCAAARYRWSNFVTGGMPIYRFPCAEHEVKGNIERLGQVDPAKRVTHLVTRSLIRWPGRTIFGHPGTTGRIHLVEPATWFGAWEEAADDSTHARR
jgi:hypothetical protein